MKTFGEGWKPSGETKESHAEGHDSHRQASGLKALLVPGISLVAATLILLAVIQHSGVKEVGGRPKTLIFFIDGFKGTLFDEIVMKSQHAPNLRRLVEEGGTYATCMSPNAPSCARAQSGPSTKTGATWTSAPGLMSIVTGVDVEKHGVTNTSVDSLQNYVSSSRRYPTLFSVAKKAGLRTAVVGTSSLLSSVSMTTGSCNGLGVLDYECGAALAESCHSPSSCNLDARVSYLSTMRRETERDILGSVERFLTSADVIGVHFNDLVWAATEAKGGSFSATSKPYLAQLYLIDAVIGQILQTVRERALANHENWLVIGASDHGGRGSSYGTNAGDDQIVALFAATATNIGPVELAPLENPRQFDVAPTVLRWMDILTSEVANNLDGRVQGICTSGVHPGNCTGGGDSGSDGDA